MTIIFMNHRIRRKGPSKLPVIRAERKVIRPDGIKTPVKVRLEVEEANRFDLMVGNVCIGRVIYDPKKNPASEHDVKAWVEIYDGRGVEVVPA